MTNGGSIVSNAVRTRGAAVYLGAGGWSSDNIYSRLLADVNGDGKADIIGFGQTGAYPKQPRPAGRTAGPECTTDAPVSLGFRRASAELPGRANGPIAAGAKRWVATDFSLSLF